MEPVSNYKSAECLNNNHKTTRMPWNDRHPPSHKLKDVDATDAQLQQWWYDPAWPTQFWCNVWGRREQWCVFLHLLVGQSPIPSDCLILGPSRPITPNGTQIQSAVFPQRTGQMFIFSWKWHFDDVELTSLLFSVVQVVMVLFIIF